jgi:aryl-alcohol dehydrogenase-like predicted oxidoreductase
MKSRRLGSRGPVVSAIGLGCMGMSEFYGQADEGEAIATLHRALELGVTLFDTADAYGPHTNERLLGRALAGRREYALVATKFGLVRGSEGEFIGVDGRPEYVRSACEASLDRLGMDHIDLYYLHRVDPKVPVEESVGAMAELVREGKVRYLGLSEVSPAELRRAHAVHPIAALQTEYSLWSRDPEGELLTTVRELGVGFVAYAPLGRGFLAGSVSSPDDLAEDDLRRGSPRFAPENMGRNERIAATVQGLAARAGVTPAQLALAWLLAQGNDIVPLPGTKRRRYLEQNVAAAEVELTPAELADLDAAVPRGAAAGDRYPDMQTRV